MPKRKSASKRKTNDDKSVGGSQSKKACQHYKPEYHELWNCLGSSKKGDLFVHCAIYSADFSCAHGGKFDCKRHVGRKSHKDLAKLVTQNTSMKDFCAGKSMESSSSMVLDRKRNVTRAELTLCTIIAKMNLSFSSAPVLTDAVKTMFPDSKIASEMTCGRSKCTALVKELRLITQESLSERMSKGPFTLSTDGSTDEKSKQYPIVVRTLDHDTGTVNSELLSVPICEGSATGENIFKLMDNELSQRNIPWDNCLSLGCDNANVMTGNKKGVYAFVREKQPKIFLAGCTLHLVHIGAKKAATALPSIEDILIDIYYFFNKSEKKQSSFKGTQDLFDLDQRRMLKHVCTRWLSIGRCVARLLYNWDALKVYFKEEKEAQDLLRTKKASASSKSSSSVKVSCAVSSSSYSESDVNVSCVASGSESHSRAKLKVIVAESNVTKTSTAGKSNSKDKLCSALSFKSKNSSAITSSKKTEDHNPNSCSKDVDTDAKSQEPTYAQRKVDAIYEFIRSPTNKLYVLFLNYTVNLFDEVLLGLQAEDPKVHVLRRMLHKLLRTILNRFVKPSGMIGKSVDQVQYKLSYNVKSNSELIIGEDAKMFISEKEKNHLRQSRIDEFYKNVVCYFQELCDYLLKKLPINYPLLVAAEVADITLQTSSKFSDLEFFIDRYPCLMPSGVTKNQLIEQFAEYQSTDIQSCIKERVDETWWTIGQLKDESSYDGKPVYKLKDLAIVMCGILTIPHSSAHCERVFSCVRKNRTEQRACLSDDSLESLLVIKSKAGDISASSQFSNSTLDHVKGAYSRSLRE